MKFGKLVVFTGTIGGGITANLIDTCRIMSETMKTAMFKPADDGRYSHTEVCDHNGDCVKANAVITSQQIFDIVCQNQNIGCIGIDEAQLFDDNLPSVIRSITALGTNVVVSGLSLDAHQRPFGVMPTLMAYADKIIELKGLCEDCFYLDEVEVDAYVSYYLGEGEDSVGGMNEYVPLCRKHAHARDMIKVLPDSFFEDERFWEEDSEEIDFTKTDYETHDNEDEDDE